MNRIQLYSCLSLSTLVFSACSGVGVVKESESDMTLSAAEQPTVGVGMRFPQVNKLNDQEEHWTVVDVDTDGNVTALDSEDCAWKFAKDHRAPAIAWDNCGSDPKWRSGSRTITKVKGTIWPLQVGNSLEKSQSY